MTIQHDIDEDRLTLVGDANTYEADNGYTAVELKNFSVLCWLGPIEIDITGVLKQHHEKYYKKLFDKLKVCAIEKLASDSDRHYKRIVG